MDGRIARQKWDSIVERTEPIMQAIEDASFTRTDLYQLADAIESQSKLASSVFKSQLELFEKQVQALKPQVQQTLKNIGVEPSNANIEKVLDKAYQKILSKQFPNLVGQLQKALLADTAKSQKKQPDDEEVEKKPAEWIKFGRMALGGLGYAFGLDKEFVDERLSEIKTLLTGGLHTVDTILRSVKYPLMLGTNNEAENYIRSYNKFSNWLQEKAEQIIYPAAYELQKEQQQDAVKVAQQKEDLKAELLEANNVPLINHIDPTDKTVDVGQVNLGPANNLLPQVIQPQPYNLDPLIDLIIDSNDSQDKQLTSIEKSSNWLVDVFKKHFDIEDVEEVKPKKDEQNKQHLISKLFSNIIEFQGKTAQKTQDLLEKIGVSQELASLLGFFALPALGYMAYQLIKRIDWAEVLRTVGSTIWDWFLSLLPKNIRDKLTSDVTAEPNVQATQGTDANGNEVTVIPDENTGQFHIVRKDKDGKISTAISDYNPTVIEDGPYKGWVVEKQEPMADATGTVTTMYNPQEGKRQKVYHYDDTGQEYTVAQKTKGKVIDDFNHQEQTKATISPATSTVTPVATAMPKSTVTPQATTELKQHVTDKDVSVAVAPQQSGKLQDMISKNQSKQGSGAIPNMTLNTIPMLGQRNNDDLFLLNTAQ